MEEHYESRTQKRESQKKRTRRLEIALVTLVILVAAFIVLGAVVKLYPFDIAWDKTAGAFKWVGSKVSSIWPGGGDGSEALENFMPDGQKTMNMLVGITKDVEQSSWMTTLMLISYDSRDGTAGIIYFPNDLLIDVPGLGLEQVINLVEMGEGTFELAKVSVENLLGIQVDRYVLGMDRDLRIILNQIAETYPVEVTDALSWKDNSLDIEVELDPGKQNLSGNVLSSYLTFSKVGQEIDLIDRQTRFMPTFFESSRDKLGQADELAKKNANLFDTDASGNEIWGLWVALTKIDPDKLIQSTVPTEEFRFEDTVVHRVDDKKLPSFIKKNVNTESKKSEEDRVKLELLNGCGVPGVGMEVASKLDLAEFKIVSSGNAGNFDYPESVIIIYGSTKDKELVSAAERVRNALEVGRIEFHEESGGPADITAIIGRDYANK
ncbi:MAG: LCP family protein [Actinobacteria bacterium]|nr:LCP family protein [Actinomycetota bacterium]